GIDHLDGLADAEHHRRRAVAVPAQRRRRRPGRDLLPQGGAVRQLRGRPGPRERNHPPARHLIPSPTATPRRTLPPRRRDGDAEPTWGSVEMSMPGSPSGPRDAAAGGAAGESIAVAAPAKINLTLEVLGRRPDGYHDIRSVMQALTLADRLEAVAADAV